MAVATPTKPKVTPMDLRQLSFSSAKNRAAKSTPKMAVEAFRIAVRPVSM